SGGQLPHGRQARRLPAHRARAAGADQVEVPQELAGARPDVLRRTRLRADARAFARRGPQGRTGRGLPLKVRPEHGLAVASLQLHVAAMRAGDLLDDEQAKAQPAGVLRQGSPAEWIEQPRAVFLRWMAMPPPRRACVKSRTSEIIRAIRSPLELMRAAAASRRSGASRWRRIIPAPAMMALSGERRS